jgi:hypothetical protein
VFNALSPYIPVRFFWAERLLLAMKDSITKTSKSFLTPN